MRTIARAILFAGALCALCPAQQWEIGANGGVGFLRDVPVAGRPTAASAGFKTGAAFGGFIGHSTYKHLGGEFHYNYLQNDLRLTSGGSEATFSGVAHVVHYDLVLRTSRKGSATQAFVAVGGGLKVFQGTGREQAYQPLSQYAYFTKTRAYKAMGSVGGGIKVALSRNVFLRTEFRDYITAFPTEIITPAPGAKISGILHDFVPMVGLSMVF